MIYFILTACITNDCEIRERDYTTSFISLDSYLRLNSMTDYKIIFVEGNGKRKTYLDELGCDVFYTRNNDLPIKNKGYKELKDVLDCLNAYKVRDTDFVVKLTGRYILGKHAPFMETLKEVYTNPDIDCIIKYSAYLTPINHRVRDCISGLIGMKAVYIRQIELPNEEAAESKWADVTYLMQESRVRNLLNLGIMAYMDSATYQYL
jgi:hypothetical protein